MRVTGIDLYASNANKVVGLSFRDPRSQLPYVAKSILGLDADDITSKFYRVSDMSNEKYYELALKKRTIVMQMGLNPNFQSGKSYSDLRDDLYKLIASSRTGAVQLRFKDGTNVVAVISGFVTKFEAPQFTKSPEVQLTIESSDPMLRSLTEVNVNLESMNPSSSLVIDDESTAPHGFRFGIKFSTEIEDFSIQDLEIPNWAFEVNLTGSSFEEFKPGDELHYSSEYNNKYLYLVRDFDIIPIVDKIVPTSVWPVIFPGENPFILSQYVNWDYIAYYPTYWGV